jgi:subtilase family serine protease
VKKSWIVAALGAASLVATALATGLPSASAAPAAKLHPAHVCKAVLAKGEATCHALKMVNDKGVAPTATAPPASGLDPAELQDAYKLTDLTSGGRTVAIVDAYGYPNLERDLNAYRGQFGLGSCSSTGSDPCLRIVNQTGGSNLPAFNVGWAQEQALDVDAVSAACPDCKILVVQANTANFVDLGAAVNTAAAQQGVVAVSNSYGGGDAPDSTYGKYYKHPGIAVTASTGDNGYQGGSYPASSSYVTAVGGTSLVTASNTRHWSETVWSGTGSGCSKYNVAVAPASFNTGCAKRAMADVSAAADPSKGGMAVYYPTSSTASTWGQFGGTSESSPIIAAVYALAGHTGSGHTGYPNATPYANASPDKLFDVISGSNGRCRRNPSQWCTARAGWDGPTGLGTPNGTGAF